MKKIIPFLFLLTNQVLAAHVQGHFVLKTGQTPTTQANASVTTNAAGAVDITEWCVCKKVTNSTCSAPIFVPTNTAAEWTNFYLNSPACVTIGTCTTDTTKPTIITASGASSITVPNGCGHIIIRAWGAGGASGDLSTAVSGDGGSGGYATTGYTSTSGGTVYSYEVGGGGGISTSGTTCTGGAAGTSTVYAGGAGGNVTGTTTATAGAAGSGSGGGAASNGLIAGTGYTGSNGGAGGYGGGGGGSVANTLGKNARCGGGGGAATVVKDNLSTVLLVAGGGGGGGSARASTAAGAVVSGGAGGAGCGQAAAAASNGGANPTGEGGGGGGGACGGTLLASSANGTGLTAPSAPNSPPTNTVCTGTLSAAITAAATSITLSNLTASCATTTGYMQIDGEQMAITALATSTFTVTRGQNATTASTHAIGAGVYTWIGTANTANVSGGSGASAATAGLPGALQFIFTP